MREDVYQRLAKHLSSLGMGYPEEEELLEILRENVTPLEAEGALAIPTKVIPFEPVPVGAIVPPSHPSQEALEQIEEVYGKTETKAFRYVPASFSLEPESHAVFPLEMMEEVIRRVKVIALVHCPCRATAQLIGKKRCDHPLENCIKYDDLAEYLIEKSIGREVTRQEALDVIRKSEEAGLVHLVDNAREGIKHICNCCGCCCWSVGTIRRKKIPRDVLMATYFLRETERERCNGCGRCVDICPVQVIRMEGDFPMIDQEWCIGCGICAIPCPSSDVKLVRKTRAIPPKDFKEQHEQILKERRP